LLIQGKGKWVKVLGEPVWGYENKHKEWSLDLYVDEETVHRLEVEGLKDKLKDKGNGVYLTFKRRELKQDGSPNQPIRVVDHHGEAWNSKTKIGNDSVLNVNFAINEYGKNQKSANILSMQVWELVKYEGAEFPTREDADGEKTWAEEAA
jgi:hypothetical protein